MTMSHLTELILRVLTAAERPPSPSIVPIPADRPPSPLVALIPADRPSSPLIAPIPAESVPVASPVSPDRADQSDPQPPSPPPSSMQASCPTTTQKTSSTNVFKEAAR